jgi:hypothetical protein
VLRVLSEESWKHSVSCSCVATVSPAEETIALNQYSKCHRLLNFCFPTFIHVTLRQSFTGPSPAF